MQRGGDSFRVGVGLVFAGPTSFFCPRRDIASVDSLVRRAAPDTKDARGLLDRDSTLAAFFLHI